MRVVLWWMTLLVLSAKTAWAQPIPNTPSTTISRDALERGLALLRAQRWAEAIPHLEEAVRLGPTPQRQYNLALAYRGAGRMAAAVRAFEQYLAAPEEGASADRLAAVREECAVLLGLVARLRVTTLPPAATVFVDGNRAVPVDGEIRVDPGTHALAFDAPGHALQRREVTLRAGEPLALEVTLRPAEPLLEASVPAPPPRVLQSITPASRETVARPRPSRASTSGSRGWVLPVALGSVALVVAGVVIAVLTVGRDVAPPIPGNWATVIAP